MSNRKPRYEVAHAHIQKRRHLGLSPTAIQRGDKDRPAEAFALGCQVREVMCAPYDGSDARWWDDLYSPQTLSRLGRTGEVVE